MVFINPQNFTKGSILLELSDRLKVFQVPKLLFLHQTEIQKDSHILFDHINDFFKCGNAIKTSYPWIEVDNCSDLEVKSTGQRLKSIMHIKF